MLSKLRKVFKSQKGFTLVELMTVLIILAIVLAIGIPKYLQIQAKSGWEADVNTIENFAKAAETYAASINQYNLPVSIDTLVKADLIDGSLELNRKNDGSNVSQKNKGESGIAETIGTTHKDVKFSFNERTGNVNNRAKVIQCMIGNPPYGGGPTYPTDKEDCTWEETARPLNGAPQNETIGTSTPTTP